MCKLMIEQQIRNLLSELRVTDRLNHIIEQAWDIFKVVLEDNEPPPSGVEEIPGHVFKAFVDRCESKHLSDGDLHLMIAVIRTALLRCGRNANTLTDLRAPRKRKRVRNGPDGRYRFELFPTARPESCSLNDRLVAHEVPTHEDPTQGAS